MCEQLMRAAKLAVQQANTTGQAQGVVGNHINGYRVLPVPFEQVATLPRVVAYPSTGSEPSAKQLEALCNALVTPREAIKLAYLIGHQSAQCEMLAMLEGMNSEMAPAADKADDAGILVRPTVLVE